MKTRNVRAGALLVGVGALCAIPAVAGGQVPGNVGNTVDGVVKQAPQVQVPKAPSVPSVNVPKAPSSAPKSSAPQSSAPSTSGGGGGGSSSPRSTAGSGSSPSTHSGSGSGAQSASSHSGTSSGSGKAHAASASKKNAKSGKGSALGQKQAAASKDKKAAGADVGDQVRPASGTGGDPKLPFTGYALIAIAALGLLALIGGVGLRVASRFRLSRRA